MGYDSLLNVVAVKIKSHENRYEKERLCVFFQFADSNLYTERNGKEVMSRSWNMLKPDSDWRIMQEIVKLSASCESGTRRWKGSSNSKAETMISACRKIIASAPTVSNLINIGENQLSMSKLELRVPKPSELDSYDLKKYDEIIGLGLKPYESSGGDFVSFYFESNSEGIEQYSKYEYLQKNIWAPGASGPWDFDQRRFDQWAQSITPPEPKKPELIQGAIVDLVDGIYFKFRGKKITRLEILDKIESKKNTFLCCGIDENGEKTVSAFLRIKPDIVKPISLFDSAPSIDAIISSLKV